MIDLNKYDTFLFDWDGTLGDSLSIWLKAYDKVLRTENIVLTYNEITTHFGDELGGKKLGFSDNDKFFKLVGEIVDIDLLKVELKPFARNLLEKIKSNPKNKTAIVTSSYRKFIDSAMSFNKLENLIDVSLCDEDVENLKPDPEQLNKAMELLGSKKESTVMIGDTDKDYKAAVNAGVDFIFYAPELHKKIYPKNNFEIDATHTISSYEELLK